MKAFTIDTENNIIVHASAKAALKEDGIEVFTTEKALGELATGWPTSRLADIWNSLAGVTPLKKFKDRATGVTRIWSAIQTLGETTAPQTPDVAPEQEPTKGNAGAEQKAPTSRTNASREGSKTSRVIELLKRPGGVTLKAIMTEMNWQSHTTRALLSAGGSLAKKHGLAVLSAKGENGDRVYSIAS